jgi:hypothetical protein
MWSITQKLEQVYADFWKLHDSSFFKDSSTSQYWLTITHKVISTVFKDKESVL